MSLQPVVRVAFLDETVDVLTVAGSIGADGAWRLPQADGDWVPDDATAWTCWITPATRTERFATRIHLVDARSAAVPAAGDVTWSRPADVLGSFRRHELTLGPPSWWTLAELERFGNVDDAVAHVAASPTIEFTGRLTTDATGRDVTLYPGDAGFDTGDADASGPRRRLVWHDHDFTFLSTVASTAESTADPTETRTDPCCTSTPKRTNRSASSRGA